MQVHHGKNEDSISILGINNTVWKAPDLAPAYVVFENIPSVRKAEDALYCGVNFDG